MKDYYEILEVHKKASKEIIDKAFKLLAKKYHPDTHEEANKDWAEEKFKEINEAYEILSNEESRKQYDMELEQEEDKVLQAVYKENEHLNNLVQQLQAELDLLKTVNSKPDNTINSNFSAAPVYEALKKQYVNYYNSVQQPAQNYTYTKTTLDKAKNFIAFFVTLLSIIGLGFIIWKIPITNKLLVNLYNNNAPIKGIVDFIFNMF